MTPVSAKSAHFLRAISVNSGLYSYERILKQSNYSHCRYRNIADVSPTLYHAFCMVAPTQNYISIYGTENRVFLALCLSTYTAVMLLYECVIFIHETATLCREN